MSIKQGSNKSKTRAKKNKVNSTGIPSAKDIANAIADDSMFTPDAVELDEGPEVPGEPGGDIMEMLLEPGDSVTTEDQELEQVFESKSEGLLEPGEGEGLKPGDMTSRNEKAVRRMIPEGTLKRMEKLILCLREYGNPTRAAQAAGITRSLAYNWRALYPGFAKVWAMAMNMAIDDLETEARRRAFQGILKPAGWYKGKAGGKVREYSDNLLMFLLKAYRPDKFKDRIEATGAGVLGVKVQITDYSHVTPEPTQSPLSTPVIEGKDGRSGAEPGEVPADDD